jgi:N-formylglutamate amidohydrolase
MPRKHGKIDDSSCEDCGFIPGFDARPAFRIEARRPFPIPVVIAAPHAGRVYPESLVAQMRNPGLASLRLEDRYVDRIAVAVARQTGAALLIADAPRAMIDLNRSLDEMDWDMIVGGPEDGATPRISGARARGGLGLVPRRLGGVGEIWNAPVQRHELSQRIAGVHKPYHEALARLLRAVSLDWGEALLLDLHSMPPLPASPGRQRPGLVLGDRFGNSCSGRVVSAALDHLSGEGMHAAYNRPYAGGYVLDRHGAPARGVHAIQIEICRSLYLDSRLAEPSARLPVIADMIVRLVRTLAGNLGMGRLDGPESLQIAAE